MGRKLLHFVTALLALLILVGALAGGFWFFREYFTYWNGKLLRLDAATVSLRWVEDPDLSGLDRFPNMRRLDLRDTGLTTEEFDDLRRRYPHCEIRWDVPFQGKLYDQDVTRVKITELTEEDILQLDYLPGLLSIDAWDCRDYALLSRLQQRRPDVKVFYSVIIGGREFDCDTWHMELTDADVLELEACLAWLPKLEELTLTGDLPDTQAIARLQQRYPQVKLIPKTTVMGLTLTPETTALDFSGRTLGTARVLEEVLPLFPGVEMVDLRDTGIPQEELVALAAAFPDTDFRFDLRIGESVFSTDAAEIDLSNLTFSSVEEVEAWLPCFYALEKAVMCECGIESEAMAALNDRHPDIRFVWSVELAGMLFRTDAVHFTPNRWGLTCTDANIADLRYCVDMVCVDVGHADNVTHCDWAANMPHLKYLILADSGVRDISALEGHTELVFLELFQSKVKDYSVLVTCTGLEDLNLCWTYGDPTPILEMNWLKRLWWSGAPWNARSAFPTALPDTEIEMKTTSSTGAGWRDGQHYFDMRDFIGMEYMTG